MRRGLLSTSAAASLARAVVDVLRRRAGDAHIHAAFFLGAALVVYEPDGLVFLHRHQDGQGLGALADGRAELAAARQAADAAALLRTRHRVTSFLTYANFIFEFSTVYGICQELRVR